MESALSNTLMNVKLAPTQAPTVRQVTPSGARKVDRNDPCPCGSGKKYKKCCWPKFG